jgi:hypothetical protein
MKALLNKNDNLTPTPRYSVAVLRWSRTSSYQTLWVGKPDNGGNTYSIERSAQDYRVWVTVNGRVHPLRTFPTTLEAAAYAMGHYEATR